MFRLNLRVTMIVVALSLLSGCMPGSDNATPLVLTPRPTSTPLPTRAQTPTIPIVATSTPSPMLTPTEAVQPSATYETLPWPENCEPEQVTQIVERFLNAFNRGDIDILRGMLPDEDAATPRNILLATASADPAAVDGVPIALEWFSMPRRTRVGSPTIDADYVLAKSVDAIVTFAADSYAAGFSIQLRKIITPTRDWVPTAVYFGVKATLRRAGEPDLEMIGKAGIDCGHQRLFVWSIGPN